MMAVFLIAAFTVWHHAYVALSKNKFSIDLNHSSYDTWVRHSHWRCNAPDVIDPGTALLTIPGVESHTKSLLLFGGRFKSTNKASKLTYIYSFDSSRWSLVKTATAPKRRIRPALVSLCQRRVILFGGYNNDTKFNRIQRFNDLWVYDTKDRNWKTVALKTTPMWKFRNGKVVSIKNYGRSCKCNAAAVFLETRNLSQFWRLDCVKDDSNNFVYEWIKEECQGKTSPAEGLIETLASTKSDDNIYMMSETWQLWRLSVRNRKWTKLDFRSSTKEIPKFDKHTIAFYNEPQEYVVFSRYRREVIVYETNQSSVTVTRSEGTWLRHDLYHPYQSVHALLFGQFPVVYVDKNNDCWQEFWWFCRERDKWKWTKLGVPLLAPTSHYQSGWLMGNEAAFQSFLLINQHIYVFIKQLSDRWISERRSERTVVGPQVWSLNLNTRTWWSYDVARRIENVLIDSRWCGSVWFDTTLVISAFEQNAASLRMWAYDVGVQAWKQLTDNSTDVPVASCGHTLVAVNNTNGILFGGKTGRNTMRALCDTWEFKVDLYLESITWHLHGSQSQCNDSSSPHRTYGHSACKAGNEMIVFGGITDPENSCSGDFWSYNLISMTWKKLGDSRSSPSLVPSQHCSCSIAATSHNLWLTVLSGDYNFQTWMYVFESRLWILVSGSTFYESNLLSKLSFLDEQRLVMFDAYDASFLQLSVGCPQGFVSPNVANSSCRVCELGEYAAAGKTHCEQCPTGLTTKSNGSENVLNCSVCSASYCTYGNCVVTQTMGTPKAVCMCNVGYSGRRCDQPTYILISIFALVVVAALSIATFKGATVWRSKGQTELALRKELNLMASAWQIHRDEVTIGRRLGGGAFGDVYESKYRGLTVAVKVLREWENARSSYEFQREILFMQTIRHPNIVLFIGCGSSEATREPFLVLEYMARGTLCEVLYGKEPVDLSYDHKIGFAVDTARGMRFLHGLNPPRIHRDLKSANLLVSDNWVVKVSDFGLGRTMTSGGPKRKPFLETRWSEIWWSKATSTVTVPLLNPDAELSHSNIGTARWRAPELKAGKEYDVSVDVFSFGILLWEIWCRKLPFNNYPFSSQVTNAISKGERPPVPTDCSPIYAALMKLSWSDNASDRPNFVHAVTTLEALQVFPAL